MNGILLVLAVSLLNTSTVLLNTEQSTAEASTTPSKMVNERFSNYHYLPTLPDGLVLQKGASSPAGHFYYTNCNKELLGRGFAMADKGEIRVIWKGLSRQEDTVTVKTDDKPHSFELESRNYWLIPVEGDLWALWGTVKREGRFIHQDTLNAFGLYGPGEKEKKQRRKQVYVLWSCEYWMTTDYWNAWYPVTTRSHGNSVATRKYITALGTDYELKRYSPEQMHECTRAMGAIKTKLHLLSLLHRYVHVQS